MEWRGSAGSRPGRHPGLLNYRSAFEFVSECLDSGDPIMEGLIREIHRKLVEGVRGGKADPGNYRRIQNYVANSSTGEVIYTPPSPVEVPIQNFEGLCPDVNRRSLQRDLKGMLDKELIKEIGAGTTDPTRHYALLEL